MSSLRAIALGFACALVPLAASASPYDDLRRAASAFAAQSGVHAEEHFSNGQTVAVDLAGADRTRVTLPNGSTELVIGNQMWMQSNGKWTKLPSFMGGLVSSTLKKYRQSPIDEIDRSSIRDLGMQRAAGVLAHAYAYTGKDGFAVTMWIGRGDLPVRTISKSGSLTTTIVYSYGQISIDPP